MAGLARDNPGALLVGDPGSAGVLSALGLPVTVARPGDAIEIGGVTVSGPAHPRTIAGQAAGAFRNVQEPGAEFDGCQDRGPWNRDEDVRAIEDRK